MKTNKEVVGESYYIDVVARLEEVFGASGVEHRFVGGVIANPVNLHTIVSVNLPQRTADFRNFSQLSLIRGDNSVRDIDAIGFSTDQATYAEARARVKEEAGKAKTKGLPYPPVSIEATSYPGWPRRNKLLQFVSTLDVDEAGVLGLNFGEVNQPTPWETFEPWHASFGQLRIKSINPYGIYLRYFMRNASGLKKKDREPVEFEGEIGYSKVDLLTRISDQVQAQAGEFNMDYFAGYESWREFIRKLKEEPDPLTWSKAFATKLYWNTVGTAFAHGAGIFKPLAHLGDRFTG